MPVPMALLVDDPCPLVHVYRCHIVDVHHREPVTEYGAPLLDIIPNDFLDRFCDVVERWGMAGKFSIVPAPGGRGDIVRGIEGFDPQLTRDWIQTVKKRLAPRFDFCPEGITHNLAVNLDGGGYLPLGESDWSQTQTRETLIPYLVRELEYLREAGIPVTGITSPWVFGIRVEREYIAAIVAAQKAVNRRNLSWYFLHMLDDQPSTRPWVAHRDEDATLVAIPSTVADIWWETIHSPRTDEEYIRSVADRAITADGKGGAIRRVLDAGGWPILLSHWQSFFSNGLETGLRVLDEVGRRVHHILGDAVEWVTCMEITERVARQSEGNEHVGPGHRNIGSVGTRASAPSSRSRGRQNARSGRLRCLG